MLAKNEQLKKDKYRQNLAQHRAMLLNAKIEALRKQLSKHKVEYTVEVAADGAETTSDDGSSQPKPSLETRTRLMTEEEIEEVVAEVKPIFKREVKSRIDRLIQEKYENPIRKLQALKDQKRLEKREKREKAEKESEDSLVEAEPVVV
jgi:hypothetical protein